MREEVKKEMEKQVEFLKADTKDQTVTYGITENGKEGRIYVKIKEETRSYHPILFCEYLFITFSKKANDAKLKNGKSNLNTQARIFLECKSAITQVAERFNRAMEKYPDCKKYDFSGIYKQIETPIQRAKLELEIKLLNSQTKTNKSNIETNRISKITNQYIALFTFIAAEYYCYEFLRDYISDLNPNKRIIINCIIIVLCGLGSIGYLIINRKWLKRDKV